MDTTTDITASEKNWYVVQAFSGYEASVKRSLEERIERAGLTEMFGEILVPTEEVVEIRGCLLYTSPSPRDGLLSRMPSSA